MSFLVIHIGYSAEVWVNDRNPLITQMGHQTFSPEQVTNMLGVSIKTHPEVSKGHWVTAPHPLSSLRLWCQKAGRFPGCQNPVSNHRAILILSLSCLAEALHGPCSVLSGQESVWKAVPKGHPCLLFWQLLAITDVPDVGWRHHCTLLGCPRGAAGAAVGWRLPQTEGIQGTPILPESPLPYRAVFPGALPSTPPPVDLTSGCSQENSEEQGSPARVAGLWDGGDTHVAVEPDKSRHGLLECAWSKREPAVHTAR